MTPHKKPEKQPPILVAAFAHEKPIEEAIRALAQHRIGPDCIGAFVGENGYDPSRPRKVYLLSILAPRRLHEEIVACLREHGAQAVGDVAIMRSQYGHVPHPGSLEYQDMKLPMGPEHWQLAAHRHGRKEE